MKTLRLSSLEFKRLLQSRTAWLFILLTLLSPLAGFHLYQPASADTMLSMYLANPALAGGMVGGLLFGVLTIYELDRAARNRMDILIDAAVSPLQAARVQLLALIAAALLTLAAVLLVWLPISQRLIGSVFNGTDYVLAYLIFMGFAFPLAILAAACAYQFTRRADLSLVLFAAFSALSLTVWTDNWQLCWLNPCVWALSDDFSNFRIFASVFYMRLTWLTALSGLWLLSYLCIRRYGQGLLRSLLHNARRIYRPAIALSLLVCSGMAYIAQPFVDHSNPDMRVMTFDMLPSLEAVSCLDRTVRVRPNTAAGTVSGTATYLFQNSSGQAQTVAFGINPGYTVSSAKANGTDVPFSIGEYQEYNEAMLQISLPADQEIELVVEYGGFPQENGTTSTIQGSVEISEEYICLTHAELAPRLLNVMPASDSFRATIEIIVPKHMTVIPFGSAQAEILSEQEDGTVIWRYESTGMGGILYAGDYIRQDIAAGGITIQFYYGRKHQAVMEAAGADKAIQAVVDYCTEHYGPLSFGTGGILKLIQSRVAGGGYAANGASLLDEADFTAVNLNDGNKGAVPGEVMIHELVHQWWGLANMFAPSGNADPWSAEGLTVYTTYRIVKDLYGEDYAQQAYVRQWQQEVDDYYLNFYVRNPAYLDALPEKMRLEISNSLTHVRQYCEMPLKILKAEELVGGEDEMDQILSGLFNRELDPAYPYLTYQNFLDACGLNEEDLNLG